MTIRNFFYGNPDVIDLAKLREAAFKASHVSDKWDTAGQAIIHHHRADAKCGGARHDIYVPEIEGSENTAYAEHTPADDVEEIGLDGWEKQRG
jgi:hypothetical protein